MQNILIDAGPMIALFNTKDQYHSKALAFLKGFEGNLWTTWPVVTETSHMLSFSIQAQINMLEWIRRDGLQLFDLHVHHLEHIVALCNKFKDVPMDLADASLIVAAEVKQITEIASIDSDFYIYRDIRNRYLTNIF